MLGEGWRVGSLGRDLRRRFEAIRLTINGCVNFAGEINGCAAVMGARVRGCLPSMMCTTEEDVTEAAIFPLCQSIAEW